MSDLRCENCTFWELANAWAANSEGSRFEKYPPPDYELVLPQSPLRWSRCKAAEEGFGDRFDSAERRMAVWDGSRYMAELLTREDFLCCEHKPRDARTSKAVSDE